MRKFLLIDDSDDDHAITRCLLAEIYGADFTLDSINEWQEGLEAVLRESYDVCFVDYRLGAKSGLDLIRDAVRLNCSTPMIILTGTDSQKTDIEAMRAGASGYLVKGKTTSALLERSIRYSITQRENELRLETLAQYDPLTGIGNRSLFQVNLESAILNRRRTGLHFALILLDIDHFKTTNDTYGHGAGDEVLKSVAKGLSAATRGTDTVARLGGDEFAVIATNIQLDTGADVVASGIQKACSQSIDFDGKKIDVSLSMGICLCPPDDGPPEELLRKADVALYQSKQKSRGSYHFYDVELDQKIQARRILEREINCALDRNEFTLHYQPIINIARDEVVRAEALIRWKHPERGLLSPKLFMEVAESTSQIVTMGERVLQEACGQAVVWQKSGLDRLIMSVNVSVAELRNAGYAASVSNALAETGLDPRCLELDITERLFMDDVDGSTRLLNELRRLGVRISLDDFGTGYSSLTRLQHLPLDCIKIDRSIIKHLPKQKYHKAIARTVIQLAHDLGLDTVAEGVETQEQLVYLARHGCDAAQGYLLSKPMEPAAFAEFCNQSPRAAAAS